MLVKGYKIRFDKKNTNLILIHKDDKLISEYNPLGIRSRCKKCDKNIKIGAA